MFILFVFKLSRKIGDYFFFQAEDGIRDYKVTGVQTCALPIFVHAGIALTLIGIAASSSFQTKDDLPLQVGQSAKVGDYTIDYRRLTADPKNERISFAAQLDVTRN